MAAAWVDVELYGFLERFEPVISSLFFGITPLDPPSYAAAILCLVTIVVFASALPARRASRTDPVVALREE
jgi:ABC-type antimicrobial peptide transport system permease subunit